MLIWLVCQRKVIPHKYMMKLHIRHLKSWFVYLFFLPTNQFNHHCNRTHLSDNLMEEAAFFCVAWLWFRHSHIERKYNFKLRKYFKLSIFRVSDSPQCCQQSDVTEETQKTCTALYMSTIPHLSIYLYFFYYYYYFWPCHLACGILVL